MIDRVTELRSLFVFFILWAVLLLAGASAAILPSDLSNIISVLVFIFVFSGYPLALLLGSAAMTKDMRAMTRVAAFFAAIVMVVALAAQINLEGRNLIYSQQLVMLALISVQGLAAHVITKSERRVLQKTHGGFISAWISFFFLPVFGLFFVHRRHAAIVEAMSQCR